MYILVEIIHTEFQYISLIKIEKELRKEKHEKKETFCPGWCYQPGQKVLFCPGCQTRDKIAPPFVPDWHSRLGNRDNSSFPTGTNQRFCSSEGYTHTGTRHTWRHGLVVVPLIFTNRTD